MLCLNTRPQQLAIICGGKKTEAWINKHRYYTQPLVCEIHSNNNIITAQISTISQYTIATYIKPIKFNTSITVHKGLQLSKINPTHSQNKIEELITHVEMVKKHVNNVVWFLVLS